MVFVNIFDLLDDGGCGDNGAPSLFVPRVGDDARCAATAYGDGSAVR
jgi:hypothetical protein